MTKLLKSSAMLAALLASTSAFAGGDNAPRHQHPGYTETTLSDAKIVRNAYGECWQNSFLETKSPECGGEAPAPAPEPRYQESVISLSDNFLFGFDKYNLRPEAIQVLNQMAGKLSEEQAKVASIMIEGHTDFKGSEEYNQKLSERRANAVRDYLIAQGVREDLINAVGLGESQARMTEQCQEQVKGIKNTKEKRLALIKCIAPDRRVDIRVRATKQVEVAPTEGVTQRTEPVSDQGENNYQGSSH